MTPTVLKLGGSVITEKDRAETLDGAALDAAADAVADAMENGDLDELVLVHGGGSFGHHHASEAGVSTTEGSADAVDAVAIHGAMKTLNQFVLSRLHDRGVPALPVHPLSAGARDADGALDLPMSQAATMLGEGFVPVLHGDVIATEGEGVTVLSGDEIVTTAAESLSAERVGLCSTVPGVLDAEDEVIPEITAFADAAHALGGSDADEDVTGGMAAKVRELLDLGAPASVFGADDIGAFLVGENPGTTIRGR
ncbi:MULTISPECIES: isopentenyl phosphate kinase [Halolamina]|uniref:Isopentenyl phosphate kinase n=1 Tax=Halolamina pelagica TaxID=699431 RepID=A0A1I5M958_9EURY|nr:MULTISPECIES: isopentenyl phosphate kinase [Halolamina]NHX35914.1 acetylglutamate kinase [Halolamina sp. R1-12]SFP05857.1 isopentenyl phosphate kinase [Halolamina pelagica]